MSKLGDRAKGGSGRRTERGEASRADADHKRVRSTVDFDEPVNQQLRVAAVQSRTSLQMILESLGTAYADGDERALEIVREALDKERDIRRDATAERASS